MYIENTLVIPNAMTEYILVILIIGAFFICLYTLISNALHQKSISKLSEAKQIVEDNLNLKELVENEKNYKSKF